MYKVTAYYNEDHTMIYDFTTRSRYLWTDHMLYTRNTIISILNEIGDIEQESARLMKNQEDIGAFMLPYYDPEIVDMFVSLLKEHISIAAELAVATKARVDVDPIKTTWVGNENDIIKLMAEINPTAWADYIIRPMWDEHLSMTAAQIQEHAAGRWVEDIESLDVNHGCLMRLATTFARGIVEQNIEKFCKY